MYVVNSYKNNMDIEHTPFSAALKFKIETTKTATQTKIAAKIGVRQGYISALKNAEKAGSVEVREAIAGFFGMSLSDFVAFGKTLVTSQKPQQPSPSDPLLPKLQDSFTRHIIEKILDLKEKNPSAFAQLSVDIDKILSSERCLDK